jgi:hypothetical protein
MNDALEHGRSLCAGEDARADRRHADAARAPAAPIEPPRRAPPDAGRCRRGHCGTLCDAGADLCRGLEPAGVRRTTTADGTITITLNALSAVDSLNAKLAAAGFHVRVAQVVPGCDAPVQIAGSDAPPATLQAEPRTAGDSVKFSPAAAPGTSSPHPANVPAGQTLVLAASKSELQVVGQINQSTAPACVRPASGQ